MLPAFEHLDLAILYSALYVICVSFIDYSVVWPSKMLDLLIMSENLFDSATFSKGALAVPMSSVIWLSSAARLQKAGP